MTHGERFLWATTSTLVILVALCWRVEREQRKTAEQHRRDLAHWGAADDVIGVTADRPGW
jgi:hypothetical protein